MKGFIPILFALLMCSVTSVILVPNKTTKTERRLLFGPSKTEQLEEKSRTEREMQKFGLTVATMDRDNELKDMEAQMNDISNSVDDIKEPMIGKLTEFTDMIERLKYQRLAQRKIYALPAAR